MSKKWLLRCLPLVPRLRRGSTGGPRSALRHSSRPSPAPLFCHKRLSFISLCIVPALLGNGCAGISPAVAPRAHAPADASATTVEADWDDADASVKVALGQVGIASVGVDRSPQRLDYRLRTPRDEPGSLTLERVDPTDTVDPVEIRVTSSIGRFGDPERERELIERVAARLDQLRGVEVAPVRR